MLVSGAFVDDRFEIEMLAGAGGMGSVYRARDLRTGEPVALKILHDPDPANLERFTREAQLLEAIRHPSIVRYVAHGHTADGALWLAMEWLDGEDLAARLSHAGLGIEESVTLATRIAGALATAHAMGVVHRDIKPSNVFLPGGRIDEAMLLDFGIARPLVASRALTRTGIVLGTPGYMAPEQARGEREVDARADVFSLGALLFECLTGKPAFSGSHVMAVLAKLLLEDPPRATELREDVPTPLSDLCAQMLAKDPALRPRDGRAVVDALDALGSMTGAAAPPHGKPSPSLTGSEQRLISAIVAMPLAPFTPAARGQETQPSNRSSNIGDALREALIPLGARVDELVGGPVLVTISGAANPADQAACAARCALAVRAILPGVPVALVTGRSETPGRLPVGSIVERAASALGAPEANIAKDASGPLPVWIDDVTRALLDVRFDVAVTERGALLLGEREVGEEARTLLGRPSPCVGREREIRAIEDTLEECIAEETCRAVLVTGPPGIGKSRLRQEITTRLRKRRGGLAVWVGRGDMVRAGSAFSLLGSALRHAASIAGSEPPEVRRDKLRSLVAVAPAPHRTRIAAFLGEIAGAPFPEEEAPFVRGARQDAAIMAEQIRVAFEDFMAAQCAAGPLVVVLEDLHWGDTPSVRLLDRALGALRDRPFALVALARPEVYDVFPRLWEGRSIDEMRLGEMGRRAAENLARNALGDAVDTALVARIVDLAAGNAFYLEELIRAVAEGRGGALPETVLGMVESRLAALEPEARRVLRAASVFGEVFWTGGIAALLGVEPGTAPSMAWLDRLVDREVLVRRRASRFAGEVELCFRHALLREGAYATMTAADRALGHRLAAEWLERAGEADPLVLATHFERAGEGARAAVWYTSAAEGTLRADDHDAAIARSERGLACGATGDLAARLWLVLSEAHALRGDFKASVPCGREALRVAPPGSRSHAIALAAIVANALVFSDVPAIAQAISLLMSLEPAPDARNAFAWSLATVGEVVIFTAQLGLLAKLEAKLVGIARDAGDDLSLVAWLENLRAVRARYIDRDPYAAMLGRRRAVTSLERVGDLHRAAYIRAHVITDLAGLGAHAEALALISAAKAAASSDASFARLLLTLSEAIVLMSSGRFDETLALTHTLLEITRSLPFMRGQTHLIRAAAQHLAGDLAEAERSIHAAEADVGPAGLNRQALLTTLAAVRLEQGRASEAVALAEEALGMAASTRVTHTSHARLLLVHANALDATGEPERARAAIAAAREDLLARAGRIDDAEMRRSFLEDVRENAATLALAAQWLGPDDHARHEIALHGETKH
ncbi:serine/threonine-protein kinase [Polyangium aurulentum]|uniref:serine/threonine-protein kinase n=1 Tax=Polyangium aurulentum TaxID=2567896 RepID=UPI0010AE9D47|nr:serine/threonine-protein kinase [Polyangium aurulentum]UQA63043.1 protein kinase [Polyangium aurulentum]